MAAKPENTFITGVHKYLPLVKDVYREKMNNPYRGGTPDWWYSGGAGDLWAEYKYRKTTPKRGVVWLCSTETKTPDLSRLQQEWLQGRHKEGRNVCVIVGCPGGGVILRNLEWERPIPAADFAARLLPRQSVAEWIRKQTAGF